MRFAPRSLLIGLTLDDDTLTTPEHPFFVLLRGWVTAAELRPGDAVRKVDGTYGLVTRIALEARPQVLYNLTVATAHTFFVG
ncbi:MAG: HINT domain-containing protein, partial [Chloroflexales bacterium]|nr:HINT domain-containing protein [Chloroflexales bacterium]